MEKRNRSKGQTTLFVIIGIFVVAAALLVFLFYPKISNTIGLDSKNPNTFLQECMQPEIEDVVDLISSQGGSLAPEHYLVYEGESLQYLCYMNEDYKTCLVQEPFLKSHIEEEIAASLEEASDYCFSEMEAYYDKRGDNVVLDRGEAHVELLPKRIVVSYTHTLSLSNDNTQNYGPFRVIVNNNLYEFVGIANSIINAESNYGDAETTLYMNTYHDLKVEKKKQIEGSTVYILTDRNTQNKFQFASRSLVWPVGI